MSSPNKLITAFRLGICSLIAITFCQISLPGTGPRAIITLVLAEIIISFIMDSSSKGFMGFAMPAASAAQSDT